MPEKVETPVAVEESRTFTDLLRKTFKGTGQTAARFLNRLGVHPDTVTLLGLAGHIGGAMLAATGHMTWAGIVILLMAPLDFLDGALARLKGETSQFGAFLDSVTDRYSEFVILGGLLVYFLQQQDWLSCGAVFLAATGSVMVSYIRARAESLGFQAKVGLLSRVERYIILIPGLLFNIPAIAIWIIAVLSHFTALQRIVSVRRQARTADITGNKNEY